MFDGEAHTRHLLLIFLLFQSAGPILRVLLASKGALLQADLVSSVYHYTMFFYRLEQDEFVESAALNLLRSPLPLDAFVNSLQDDGNRRLLISPTCFLAPG